MTRQPEAPNSSAVRPGAGDAFAEPVDRVAEAVRAVPGVADLSGGVMGEVGTYLPGRRVAGVRLRENSTDIHVTVEYGRDVRRVAHMIRHIVGQLTGTSTVNVTIADLRAPDEAVNGKDDGEQSSQ